MHSSLCFQREFVAFLKISLLTLMHSLESIISRNHTIFYRILKHLNAYSNVMADKWAYVDTAFFTQK